MGCSESRQAAPAPHAAKTPQPRATPAARQREAHVAAEQVPPPVVDHAATPPLRPEEVFKVQPPPQTQTAPPPPPSPPRPQQAPNPPQPTSPPATRVLSPLRHPTPGAADTQPATDAAPPAADTAVPEHSANGSSPPLGSPGITPESPELPTPPQHQQPQTLLAGPEPAFDVTQLGMHGVVTPAATSATHSTTQTEHAAGGSGTAPTSATDGEPVWIRECAPPSLGGASVAEHARGSAGDVPVAEMPEAHSVEPSDVTPSLAPSPQLGSSAPSPKPLRGTEPHDADESYSMPASPAFAHEEERLSAAPIPTPHEFTPTPISAATLVMTTSDLALPLNPADPARPSLMQHSALLRASCMVPPETQYASPPPSSHSAADMQAESPVASTCELAASARTLPAEVETPRPRVYGGCGMGGVSQLIQMDGEGLLSDDDGNWLVRPGDSPSAAPLGSRDTSSASPAETSGLTPQRRVARHSLERVRREEEETEDFLRLEQGILKAEACEEHPAPSPQDTACTAPDARGTCITVSPGPVCGPEVTTYSPGVYSLSKQETSAHALESAMRGESVSTVQQETTETSEAHGVEVGSRQGATHRLTCTSATDDIAVSIPTSRSPTMPRSSTSLSSTRSGDASADVHNAITHQPAPEGGTEPCTPPQAPAARESDGFEPMPPPPEPMPQTDADRAAVQAAPKESALSRLGRLAGSRPAHAPERATRPPLTAPTDAGIIDDVGAFVAEHMPVLDLRGRKLRDPTAMRAQLIHTLQRCKGVVTEFYVGADAFDGTELVECLTACTKLQVLDISGCTLREPDVLSRALAAATFPSLHTLVLSRTGLTGGTVGSVFRAASACGALRSLTLADNALGAAGLQAMLRDTHVNNALETLDVSGVGMVGRGVQTVGMLLRRLRRVNRLVLSRNTLAGEGSACLSAMVLATPVLKVVVAEDCGLDEQALRKVMGRATTLVVGEKVLSVPAVVPGKLTLCVGGNGMGAGVPPPSERDGAVGSAASPISRLGGLVGMKTSRRRV